LLTTDAAGILNTISILPFTSQRPLSAVFVVPLSVIVVLLGGGAISMGASALNHSSTHPVVALAIKNAGFI